MLSCPPLATLAANRAAAITLCLHTPRRKVSAQPLGRDRVESLAGELADFIEVLPRVLLAFEALHTLRFRFCYGWCHDSPTKSPEKQKAHPPSGGWALIGTLGAYVRS